MSLPPGPPNYKLGFERELEDDDKSKFLQKAKDNPMVPIGITGGLSALAYSLYKFKTRDRSTKLSVYLIHTRMAAQGAVVGSLTLGVLYKLYSDYIAPAKTSKD